MTTVSRPARTKKQTKSSMLPWRQRVCAIRSRRSTRAVRHDRAAIRCPCARSTATAFLATDRDIAVGLCSDEELQAVRVQVGRGSVTAINATPFGNRDLTEIDHGKLFVGATQLRRGDRIIFHFRARAHVTARIDVAARCTRRRARSASCWQRCCGAAACASGRSRAATDTARRSLAEQIRGTGQFTVRLGGGKALHAAAVRALQEAAQRRIARLRKYDARRTRRSDRASERASTANRSQQPINHGGARRPSDLAHTIALLESARRKILE